MTVAGTGSSSASLVVNGLISGINTPQVIQALLQAYQIPITDLQNQQSSLGAQAADYKTLNSDLQAVQNAAQALNTPNSWDLMTASSSNTTVATATSSPGAQPGTLSFSVNALAQGNVMVSSGGVSSQNATVTSASSLLIATGGAAVGFSALSGSSGLALGKHTVSVTQSSAAASIAATTQLGGSTTITSGSNDTVSVTVNGTAYTLTIAAGTYTPSALVAAVDQAAAAAGAPIQASLSSTGMLEIATSEQGSGASLSVTGGTALTTLGLSSGASAQGADAIVSVDGTATTLSAITPGSQVTLAAPTGAITATIAAAPGASGALVTAGNVSSALVSTGNGSLANLISGIDNAGIGMTASAVQDSSGLYRLQISANQTGLAGQASVDTSALSSGPLSSLSTIAAAQDASVSVGGASGYTVSSSSNVFSNLMPGSAITVAATGQATVTVSQDAAGEAKQVASLVSAANQALGDINKLTAFDPTTKTGGPLMGSAVVQNLRNQIESMFASVGGTSGLANAASVGITLNSDGSLSFNQQSFEAAFSANPQQVAALFTQGGTFAPSSSGSAGEVSLVYAGNQTATGTYAVSISQSAAQATDTGSTLASGTVSAGETLTISSGTIQTSFATTAGESLATIASGLNSAFATAGLNLAAQVVSSGTQLQITSNSYGSAAQFSVSSSAPGTGTTGLGGTTAGVAANFAGTDVAGTINGVAATGTGQVLAAPSSDPTLNGLSLLVSATGITSPTALGSFTYTPGLAQQLVAIADQASNATNGSLTTTINSLNAEATGLNSQIANYQTLEQSQQAVLQKEFTTMETTLGQLKSEGSSLSSAISGLAGW